MLRKTKVVGKFVEFFGPGAAALQRAGSRHDREHGAGVRRDDGILRRSTRRRSTICAAPAAARNIARRTRDYYKAQGLWGIPEQGSIDYIAGRRTRSRDGDAERRRVRSARRTASSSAALKRDLGGHPLDRHTRMDMAKPQDRRRRSGSRRSTPRRMPCLRVGSARRRRSVWSSESQDAELGSGRR